MKPVHLTHYIKGIFPPYLVLVILVPCLISYMINYNLASKYSIIVNVIWLPIFLIIYHWIKKKWIYRLIVCLYFIVGLLEITHWIILKGPITITSMLVISSTNFEEAVDFMNLKISYHLLVLIPYTWLFIRALKPPSILVKSKSKMILNTLTLVTITLFAFLMQKKNMFLLKGVPQIVRVSHAFLNELQVHKLAIANAKLKKVDANYSGSERNNTIVLILGESLSRNHMSLYGYPKETNPKLTQREDIFLFNNVISSYSTSINNILSLLSDSNIENGLKFNKSTDILDLAYSAGYETYWISNQSPLGLYDNLVTALAKKSPSNIFVNTSSNSSAEAMTKRSYDEKLIPPFKFVLSKKASKKLIILHLMGSHISYKKRYPKPYSKYSGSSAKEKIIADYDNSVLYNDFVIDSLLNILNLSSTYVNSNSAAVYLSDHGENIYDEFDMIGHDYTLILPKANVEIPFFLWVSPKNALFNERRFETIRENLDKPYVSDDLFHSLLDLTEIRSKYYESERSIFNETFDDKRKRILIDGNDYDEPYPNQ